MRIRSMAIAAGVAVLAAVPLSAAPASANGHEGELWAQNLSSYKCLSIGQGNHTEGALAIQFDCSLVRNEENWYWDLVPGATSTYTLENVVTEQCLAIGGASHTNGAGAIQWPCESGHPEQQWIYDGNNRLRNKESGRCLAVPHGSEANSVALIQWTCEVDKFDQEWAQ
ncbi:RICIN domain-containing protein [Streptomyces sp. CA-111067]|uniref:RICIN domain-containing protein n=1 Tax=Streptomyces sp. CA-111067 TaxID=3240046 RepID=UPI003D95FCB8